MGRGLTLLAGPANAGKVALLLERYVGALQATAAPAKPATAFQRCRKRRLS